MANIIIPGVGPAVDIREDSEDEIYWTEPFEYKGFFVQIARYKGRYKGFAKEKGLVIEGKQITLEFESDWKYYYSDCRNQLQDYINQYRSR